MPVVTRAASLRQQGLAQEQGPPMATPDPGTLDMEAMQNISASGPDPAIKNSVNDSEDDSEQLSPIRPASAAFTPDPETASKQFKTAVELRDD